MLRKAWRIIEVLLMVLGVAAIPVIAMKVQDHGLREAAQPPWSVNTLDDFRKWRPQYDRAMRLETGGSTYYLVLGEPARVLASGPASYLFDARGNFIGWTLDTGDNPYLRVASDQTARKNSLSTSQIAIEPPR
jgi:hypothetical protein